MTMRYCGLRILPIRRSRILTATWLLAPGSVGSRATARTPWGLAPSAALMDWRHAGLEGSDMHRIPADHCARPATVRKNDPRVRARNRPEAETEADDSGPRHLRTAAPARHRAGAQLRR